MVKKISYRRAPVVDTVFGKVLGKFGILTPPDPGNRGCAARYVDCAWLQVPKLSRSSIKVDETWPNWLFLATRPHLHFIFNNHQVSSAYLPCSAHRS